jgi:cytochrome P450
MKLDTCTLIPLLVSCSLNPNGRNIDTDVFPIGGSPVIQFPVPNSASALRALGALIWQKHLLASLEVFHRELGNAFQIELPGFRAILLAGQEANHLVLVKARQHFLWRNESDAVTKLLRHGLLVEDGEVHDALRRLMSPPLHREMVATYVPEMAGCADKIIDAWHDNARLDFLVEMRRVALVILMDTLFGIDVVPDLRDLWQPILKALRYISPGLWMFWPGMQRSGFRRALRQLDDYLYRIIAARRSSSSAKEDLLGTLIAAGLPNADIRDQLLTMLIAGHDTSTALLSWAFYLLATHSNVMARAREEVDRVLGTETPTLAHTNDLAYVDQVIKETLRLYPPIHLGSRIAADDIDHPAGVIPAGTRVLYSIYLTHRDPQYWPDPDRFDPDRFSPDQARLHSPYQFLPFGGGSRNCIGRAFAQVEAKIVLARILQKFDLAFVGGAVRPHMGATLEPYPGVMMRVQRR